MTAAAADPAGDPVARPVTEPGGLPRTTLADLALVAVGGALGGPARFAVEDALPAVAGEVPWGTVTVNLVGALLLGVLVGADGWGRRRLTLLVGTGFMGAFTTFSTWVLEVVRLIPDSPLVAAVHLVGLAAAGVVVAAGGVAVGRRLSREARR